MSTLDAVGAAFAEASAATPTSDSPTETVTTPPTPATTTETPTTQAGAAKPATEPTPVQGSEELGPIPPHRHKAILEKQRAESAAELAKYEWAKGLDPAVIQERLKAIELAETDPEVFLSRYERTLSQDPRFAGLIAARRNATSVVQPVQEDPRPLPDVDLEDGRQVYGADQALKLLEWNTRQIVTEMTKRFGPLEEEHRGKQEWDRALNHQREVLAEARTWEGFTQYENEIREHLMGAKNRTIESSYRAVVIPKLKADRVAMEAELRKTLLADLNSKGNATTETPGSTPAPSPKKDYKGVATSTVVEEVVRELRGR